MSSSRSFLSRLLDRKRAARVKQLARRRAFVQFESLESRLLLAYIEGSPSPLADVVANGADNAILYRQGANSGNAAAPFDGDTTGQVTIDNQNTEFAKFLRLQIQGMEGQDVIELNNPTVPTGMTQGVLVSGSNFVTSGTTPTFDNAHDTLIVVDNHAAVDAIIQPTGATSGNVFHSLAGDQTVVFAAFEDLEYDGNTNNSLEVRDTNGVFRVTPGPDATSGTFTINGRFPIQFRNIEASGSVFLNETGGGTSSLTYDGTGGDDAFRVFNDGTSVGAIELIEGGFNHVDVRPRTNATSHAIETLNLQGGDGDDTFTLGPFATAHGYTNISISGGSPSASDVANLTGNGSAITVTFLADNSVTVSGGGLGTVANPLTLDSVEIININAVGGNLLVNGTAGTDSFLAAPIDANTVRIREGDTGPVVFGTTTASFSVTEGTANDGDTLSVQLTPAAETVTVDNVATTGQVTVTLPAATLKRIDFTSANIESLRVLGDTGADVFNVTVGALPIFIDGGDPIGEKPGDTINISGTGSARLSAGPQKDEGSVKFGTTTAAMSYDRVETVNISGGSGAVIDGTNADDVITIIARDASYVTPTPTGLNGVRDFTASVNEGTDVLFIDQATLIINALSGSDDIVLRLPAPNDAAWNVAVTVNGAAPSADGDTLIIETPGQDTVEYRPDTTSAHTGQVRIRPGGTQTDINFNQIEELIYDGEGGNDSISVFGHITNADTIIHRPGNFVDAGQFQINSTLPLRYQDLGAAGTLTAAGQGGNDVLVYEGTQTDDRFTVSIAGAVDLVASNLDHVDVAQVGVEQLRLEGLDGDDSFTVNAAAIYSQGVQIFGGAAAGALGDSATLVHSAASTASLDLSTGQVANIVTGAVSLSGVEGVSIVGTDAVADQFTVANYGAASDLERITLDGGDTNNNDNDTINIQLTGTHNTVTVAPTSVSTASISRAEGGPTIDATRFNNGALAGANLSIQASANQDTVAIAASSDSDRILLVRDNANSEYRATVTSATTRVPVGFSNTGIEALHVLGNGGDDTLAIDNTGGLIELTDGIFFDGGDGGNDFLQMFGATSANTTYFPGPGNTDGTVLQTATGSAASQRLVFIGLEPFLLRGTGAADTLTVSGQFTTPPFPLNADNSVNYTVGPNSGNAGHATFMGDTTGLIAVDEYETIEFSNYGTVIIDAGPGSDVIHLNHGGTPTALTTLDIRGGDPTTNDHLIVNDRVGTAVSVALATPTSVITNAEPVTINYREIEELTIVRGAGGGTNVAISGSANYAVNPGLEVDENTVVADQLPVNLDGYGSTSTVTLTGTAANTDTLILNGTLSDDKMSLSAGGDVRLGTARPVFDPATIESVTLDGLVGTDTFNVAVDTSVYTASATIRGGDSTNDRVVVTGAAGVNDTIGLALATAGDSLSGVLASAISLIGVEDLTVNSVTGNDILSATNFGATSSLQNVIFTSGGDALDTFALTGTAGPDSFQISPTSDTAVTATASTGNTTITTTLGAAATSTYSVSGGNSNDEVTVNGTLGDDIVTVTRANSPTATTVNMTGLKIVTLTEDAPNTLVVATGTGSDRVTVTGTGGPDVTIDGGTGTNDTLTVAAVTGITTVSSGVTPDAGLVAGPGAGAVDDVQFQDIDSVSITGSAAGDTLIVEGTT
ncbi:MAG: hypothetical protein O3C40_09695, partial [Planctomycetota bacterium]|nr:hypothetical protein [Planctomycetota bacterium]